MGYLSSSLVFRERIGIGQTVVNWRVVNVRSKYLRKAITSQNENDGGKGVQRRLERDSTAYRYPQLRPSWDVAGLGRSRNVKLQFPEVGLVRSR